MLPSEGENSLVAIIDDEPAMRSSLVDLMRSAGYRAMAFASGEEFLGSPMRMVARCIVTDIQLPGINGFDLKHLLDEECPDVPVIMITARVDQYPESQVSGCGAVCFLRKPFEASALLACVETSLTS